MSVVILNLVKRIFESSKKKFKKNHRSSAHSSANIEDKYVEFTKHGSY